jgi:hypothetical protein
MEGMLMSDLAVFFLNGFTMLIGFVMLGGALVGFSLFTLGLCMLLKSPGLPPAPQSLSESTDLIADFVQRHGWHWLDEEDRVPQLESCGMPQSRELLFHYYDEYCLNRLEEELGFSREKFSTLYKFTPEGHCVTFYGTRWKVAVYELERIFQESPDDAAAGPA